jgi:YesN/AraC family two-component response regulator
LDINQAAAVNAGETDDEKLSADDDVRKSILIAEDNKEMQIFLYKIFRTNYNVIFAGNGKEALDKLGKHHVDLIISDIMMPVMDGLELSRKVKSLLNYSHIPFIMLTAKTGVAANIEGLEAGVDAYVEKPFSTSLLQARVENLFDNRKKMQKAFSSMPLSGMTSIASSKADEKFLQRVSEMVYEHMTDESFNIDALADKLNMSRSSLHRKIKNMSELTPNDFILVVRLKKAAELLQAGEYRINEVGYVVGFSSSSYFSKSFKKHFGLTPSEFTKKK